MGGTRRRGTVRGLRKVDCQHRPTKFAGFESDFFLFRHIGQDALWIVPTCPSVIPS